MPLRSYYVLVDRWTTELVDRAPSLFEQYEKYRTVPNLFLAKATDASAAEIGRLPGVRTISPTTVGTQRVVHSIDYQVMIAMAHRDQFAPNGVANAAETWHPAGEPKMPTLHLNADGLPVWGVDEHMLLPTRLCLTGALNLSLEPDAPFAYHPEDPVCVAMEAAANTLPVVLAAGNADPGEAQPLMFGWTQSPSVIVVGATDPDGRNVCGYSRVGDPQHGLSGPTVVANGTDESGDVGTSYAAPVVSTQLACLAAACMLLRAVALQLIPGGKPEGVPLAGRCFVDLDSLPGTQGHGAQVHDFALRRRKLPCLPITGVNTDAVVAALDASGRERSPLLKLPHPRRLRNLLTRSAVPVPGAAAHEAGAGFVSDATTAAFLARLDGAALLAPGDAVDDARCGGAGPLFDPAILPEFLAGVRDSMLGWASDITRYTSVPPEPVFVEQRPNFGD